MSKEGGAQSQESQIFKMVFCYDCGTEDPNCFAPHAIKRNIKCCIACSKVKIKYYRGSRYDPARRLLFNIKSQLRSKGRIERNVWTLTDTEKLVEDWKKKYIALVGEEPDIAGRGIKFRVRWKDPARNYLPENAELSFT